MKVVTIIWGAALVAAITAVVISNQAINAVVVPQTLEAGPASAFCGGTVTPEPSYCLGAPDGVTTLTDGSQDLTLANSGFNDVTDALHTSAGINVYQGQ